MRTEAPYVATVALAAALAVIFLVPVGCSPREAAAPSPAPAEQLAPTPPAPQPSPPPVEPSSPPPVEPSSSPDASPTPTTEPQPAKPSTVPAAPPVSASASPATTPVSELPAATSPPSTSPPSAAPPSTSPPSAAPPPAAPRPSDSQPAPGASGVVDPGGEIAVEATRPGLTRIGAAKCGMCHKLQYASWSETAHAKRKPPLACESCHGAGSEYKSLAVMKDAEKAKAAGLVLPTATFCVTCHREGWSDDRLRKAHAHKEPPKP